ncbi:MAG: efflux RND transporter periplasmic adaptor subunit [Deltaproteobacteria bacterium]|nr:efflux RND transporter periplasmic adaptor subunit [Deltaproteobacteria bacterium]
MKRAMAVFFIVTMTAGLFGCKGKDNSGGRITPESVYNVRVWKAVKEDVPQAIAAVGTLEPEEEVEVSAEVSARLTRVFRDEGAMVGSGERLALLDEETFRLKVSRANADLERALSDLDFAFKDLERKEALFREGIVSKENHEESVMRKKAASAMAESAKAALSLAERDLENSRVKAPFSGVLSEKYVSTGGYVREGEKLFKLMNINPVKVSAGIPERYLGAVSAGQTVSLRVAPVIGEFMGRIYFISPHIDDATRTFEIKARIKNPDGVLRPGFFADVTITTGMKKGIFLVPENGVVTRDDKRFVFVVKDGAVEERAVVIGERAMGKIEVIKGVEEGETVVKDGAHNLKDGSKVNVVTD